ncbi:hypothetical protein TREMEDRAFT_62603 [Tremella mesenterica DSM 1558]|uniref:uncharacterized protein n=1 Tax=Tremella mesenterica (strain ATCC 24925 / CBS 8224 / DSM 1558 / NBRC 9311 / NRRL Y-6157 / RJB 2259-6 / UBC 559-6) TaxID=578456 RepID=UPI0003F4A520|nr:uncharacterized protein TREMEDRAFT_62603 [Tremella mesenterica DSM 1558]EIW68884.1 hypothetical protein TREMEDRAFT_62603 [Tremella mesenterica DSM 1558]
MPYISTEALAGATLLLVLVFGYQYIPKASSDSAVASKSKKKQKKKNRPVDHGEISDTSMMASQSDTSRAKASEADLPSHTSTTSKQKSKARASSQSPAQTGTTQPLSFASVAASHAGPSRPKTLAERIAPKPVKTKVDDMLAPEDRPIPHARVMRIQDPSLLSSSPVQAIAQKVDKFSDDYDSSSSEAEATKTEEDDGWDVVPARPKSEQGANATEPISLSLSQTVATQPTSRPLPVATKVQKKNAKKAEAKKAAKLAEEEERRQRLGAHKRVLERSETRRSSRLRGRV